MSPFSPRITSFYTTVGQSSFGAVRERVKGKHWFLYMINMYTSTVGIYSRFKAVDWGDKRTQRLRVQVLALRENPRRVRVRVLALLENPRRDWVLEPALRENPRRERVLDCWFEARDSSVDILVLVPWFEYGTRTRMSTDGWLEPRTMDLNGTKKHKQVEPFSDTISY